MAGPAAAETDLEVLYARILRQAGQTVRQVIRVLPPKDSGGEAEVLFLDGGGHPLTAYVADRKDAEPLIAAGW